MEKHHRLFEIKKNTYKEFSTEIPARPINRLLCHVFDYWSPSVSLGETLKCKCI